MGFMDKVKAQAEQAKVMGQQAVAQGQSKINDLQSASRSQDALLRELGAAYYDQQRTGGPASAVAEALAALDVHYASPSTPPSPPAPPTP